MRAYYRRQFAKEVILSRMQPEGPFPLVLVLDHMKPTFNVGKIIRTANALGIREVDLVGMAEFNPKPCKGTLRKTRTRFFESFAECHARLAAGGYSFYALSPDGDATLGIDPFPPRTAIIIGHEEYGHSFDFSAYPAIRRLRIPQFGAVQSLNASVAAAIASYEYLRQRSFLPATNAAPFSSQSDAANPPLGG